VHVEFMEQFGLSSYLCTDSTTELEANNKATPIGMKTIPTSKNEVITGTGVKMGCHAGSCCCLNAVRNGRFDGVLSGMDIPQEIYILVLFIFHLT